ncbi:MAG: hypothetical protein ACFE0P_01705 [Oceanicaulis sp.]
MESVKINSKAIEEAILRSGKPVKEITKAAQIDRKTLSNLRRGKPVRVSTVVRLAHVLGVDVKQITERDDLKGLKPRTVEFEPFSSASIELVEATYEDVRLSLGGRSETKWKLDVPTLSDEQGELILRIEGNIAEIQRVIWSQDLGDQVRLAQSGAGLEQLLEELRAAGLNLLVGSQHIWRNEIEETTHPYDGYPITLYGGPALYHLAFFAIVDVGVRIAIGRIDGGLKSRADALKAAEAAGLDISDYQPEDDLDDDIPF